MADPRDVHRIAVLGAGTMGHGIAQLAAQSGFETRLYDVDEKFVAAGMERIKRNLDKAVQKGKLDGAGAEETLGRLKGEPSFGAAVSGAQLIIEAAPEQMPLKVELFGKLGELCAPEVVLATNTSGLSITEIAACAPHPERVVGMHFFNPAYIMKLLEVVRAWQTDDVTLATALAVGAKMRRECITVTDSPGFASSRLGIALAMEAIRMLETGVASAADIDKAMELGYRHPMGPLKLTDLVGLDVRLAIAEHLHRELGGEQFRPPPLLRKLVRAGKLGRKSGAGFYDYEDA